MMAGKSVEKSSSKRYCGNVGLNEILVGSYIRLFSHGKGRESPVSSN